MLCSAVVPSSATLHPFQEEYGLKKNTLLSVDAVTLMSGRKGVFVAVLRRLLQCFHFRDLTLTEISCNNYVILIRVTVVLHLPILDVPSAVPG